MKQKVLDQFLSEMLGLLQSAKSFSVTQLPEVAQQVLRYRLIISVFLLSLCIVVYWALYNANKRVVALWKEKDPGAEEVCFWGWIAIAIIWGITSKFSFNAVDTIIQILAAPKVFLIEYFSRLVSH